MECKIDVMDKVIHKLRSERDYLYKDNKILHSENSHLKSQVSFYEESFAKSSLIGGSNLPTTAKVPSMLLGKEVIQREELDNYKLNVLEKINRRFDLLDREEKKLKTHLSIKKLEHDLEETKSIVNRSMIDTLMAPQDKSEPRREKRRRVDSGEMAFEGSSGTSSDSSSDDLVMKKEGKDYQSKGYMLLAIVFGVIYASSCLGGPVARQNSAAHIPASSEIMRMNNMRGIKSVGNNQDIVQDMEEMTLHSSHTDDQDTKERKAGLRELARSMKSVKADDVQRVVESFQGPHSLLLKQIVSGQYNYLGYLMCGAMCSSYWMNPM